MEIEGNDACSENYFMNDGYVHVSVQKRKRSQSQIEYISQQLTLVKYKTFQIILSITFVNFFLFRVIYVTCHIQKITHRKSTDVLLLLTKLWRNEITWMRMGAISIIILLLITFLGFNVTQFI